MIAEIYDDRPCELGEGPLWHPERAQLFWVDILGKRLLSRADGEPLAWDFGEHVSAMGRVDRDSLLIASESGLHRFDIARGTRALIVPIEADRPETRSNDGRADPMGGFWIGTMGKRAEPGAGAIYRYHGGVLRQLHTGVTIPNAICFAPGGRTGYFADTAKRQIFRQGLDAEGWPEGEPEVFLDLGAEGLSPDGAVIDAEGALLNAQWGAGRVARYLPDGRLDRTVEVGGILSSCPAFGGDDLKTLFITTAREGLSRPDGAQGPVYRAIPGCRGLPEPPVRL